MPTIAFYDLLTVIDKVTSTTSNTRWAVLVGSPMEPLHDYMVQALDEMPLKRNLSHALTMDWGDESEQGQKVRRFVEEACVISTPSLLLVKRGSVEATISGAIPHERLKAAIETLCEENTEDRLAAAMAEMEDPNRVWVLPPDPQEEFVQIGVAPSGQPIFMKASDVPVPDPVPPSSCATCDGGGCPDCTD
ncbi:thioredoxin [Gordonia phage WhoseManz]|nr:thioredoxin [Gordonia phage WhoseManz]